MLCGGFPEIVSSGQLTSLTHPFGHFPPPRSALLHSARAQRHAYPPGRDSARARPGWAAEPRRRRRRRKTEGNKEERGRAGGRLSPGSSPLRSLLPSPRAGIGLLLWVPARAWPRGKPGRLAGGRERPVGWAPLGFDPGTRKSWWESLLGLPYLLGLSDLIKEKGLPRSFPEPSKVPRDHGFLSRCPPCTGCCCCCYCCCCTGHGCIMALAPAAGLRDMTWRVLAHGTCLR
ncbi:hypothetical protein JRQ81_012041 [Phrynocephalus forsythii]|uniref:Uncharacterized protein n=1 Tax=Phrynocephalus forsythii TaxID=171643 RepID=A0A9Q0X8W4_9SAUR|nr:hypothetical protein JRQ81_012041 [Phrynocephalus forsythii]